MGPQLIGCGDVQQDTEEQERIYLLQWGRS